MQIVATGVRCPFVTDEAGEAAGLVVFLRRLDSLLPGRAVGRRAGKRLQLLREGALGEGDNDFGGGLDPLLAAGLHHVVPLLAGRVGQHFRVTRIQPREEAHVVGMIGDHEEIERSVKLHFQAGRRSQLFAAREAVGVFRDQPCAEGAGVHRHSGVQVGVAPEDLARKVASRVGREMHLSRKCARRGVARGRQAHGMPGQCRAGQAG